MQRDSVVLKLAKSNLHHNFRIFSRPVEIYINQLRAWMNYISPVYYYYAIIFILFCTGVVICAHPLNQCSS